MDKIKDLTGKELEIGHIVAVRYVWNSYVGEITLRGLCATGAERHAFFSPHKLHDYATYQILSNINEKHIDFNRAASNWYKSEDAECPIKIRVYENVETETHKS